MPTLALEPPSAQVNSGAASAATLVRRNWRALLVPAALLALSLGMRLFALDWGIPNYDPHLPESPYRHSYHIDEDNFLWGLALMRPSEGNFDVKIYHWGTLQFYLIYAVLLVAEVIGVIPAPWEVAFHSGDLEVLPRLYVLGRLVSVGFGAACTLVVWALAGAVGGRAAAGFAGLAYAVAPLAVMGAHYLTNDVTMSALLAGGVLAAVVAVQRGRTKFLRVAGLLFGLAIAAKYSALFGVPALSVAQWFAWRATPVRNLRTALLDLLLPWLAMGIGFIVGEPYALIMPGAVLEGVQAANRGNGLMLSLGPGPPLRMLGLHALHLGGLGLTWPLALLALAGLVLMTVVAVRPRSMPGRSISLVRVYDRTVCIIILAAVAGSIIGIALNRVFMLRYGQPLVPFLIVAAGVAWAALPRPSVRLAAGAVGLVPALVVTLGQLFLMSGPHPANGVQSWLQANLKPGEQVARLWPEYPVLDETRYRLLRIDPWYPDLPSGTRPDYIIMDDMQLGPPSPALQTMLSQEYREVARFGARPHVLGFAWDEGSTPHDWKYSHPTFVVYRRE